MVNLCLKNILHITINSKDIVEYPDHTVIFDEMRPIMERMMEQAITTGIVLVWNDGRDCIEARCAVDFEAGLYMATLYIKDAPEIPLLETTGAINAAAGEKILEYLNKLYKVSWEKEAPDIKCLTQPFIGDFVFPSILLAPWITHWTGDFTKCFGIYMLNLLSQYQAMKKMERSSEPVRDGMILGCRVEADRDYAIFDADRDGIAMKIFFNNLTQTEVKEFATKKDIYMGMTDLEGVAMFAIKVGNLNWIAVPVIPCLTRCLKKSGILAKGKRIDLKVVLVDAGTGETKWVTGINLPESFRERFIAAKIKGKKVNKKKYAKAVERIYSNYSIQHVVESIESSEMEEC